MCGIVGIFNLDGRPVDKNLLSEMRDTMIHRGPDDAGLHVDKNVGLGHRRLSILDLSPAGKQPLPNEDGTVFIVYNGEIYNYPALKTELESCGHVFSSKTDSEVIVHAYEQWGLDAVRRFDGMFAFGLWDSIKKRMWVVRDRIGIKPLFYFESPSVFAFASEIKGLLRHDTFLRSVDYRALAYYLSINFVPAPFTLFKNIRQVLPGHYIVLEQDGNLKDIEYWHLDFEENVKKSPNQWADEFDSLMEETVRNHLISDVPFGSFLSGGLDSSSLTFWMTRCLQNPPKTFSIAFSERTYNESRFSRKVAKRLGTSHYEMTVKADAVKVLPKLVYHSEEPTADSSMLAVYYLAEMSRREVTMALSGDGADEILAGYETYPAYYMLKFYRTIPKFLRRSIIPWIVEALPVSDKKVSLKMRLKRFVVRAENEPEDAHAFWRIIYDASMRHKLLAPVWSDHEARSDILDIYRQYFKKCRAVHPLNRLLYVDTTLYLPNDMLTKIDRMTMAHSLEARVPYLDHKVVEFAARIPPSLKLKALWQKKYILKYVMRGRIPAEIIKRKKEGFSIPVAKWIKGELKDFTMDILSPKAVNDTGILDSSAVTSILEEHLKGKRDYGSQIWSLIVLMIWWKEFLNHGR